MGRRQASGWSKDPNGCYQKFECAFCLGFASARADWDLVLVTRYMLQFIGSQPLPISCSLSRLAMTVGLLITKTEDLTPAFNHGGCDMNDEEKEAYLSL